MRNPTGGIKGWQQTRAELNDNGSIEQEG